MHLWGKTPPSVAPGQASWKTENILDWTATPSLKGQELTGRHTRSGEWIGRPLEQV
jgi:hypothetical protein